MDDAVSVEMSVFERNCLILHWLARKESEFFLGGMVNLMGLFNRSSNAHQCDAWNWTSHT